MSDGTKLFEPDTLMPEQFFAGSFRDDGAANERQLMLAILRDAVDCHQKYARTRSFQGQQLFAEADDWIYSGEREWPFSFENICDTLGVDSGYIRAGLAPGRGHRAGKRKRTPQIVAIGERINESERFLEGEVALPRAS